MKFKIYERWRTDIMIGDWDSPEKRRELGSRLQWLREANGITQLRLSELAGCSKDYISAVERGINKLTVPLLLEYCRVLNMSPDSVLGYTGDALEDELYGIIRSLDKEQQQRALKILEALK